MLCSPDMPDGTLPRCVLLVCIGQEFDDLEVSRTIPTVLVSVITAEQKAPMVWLKLTRVCGVTRNLQYLPLTCSSECSLASVSTVTASHDCDGLTLHDECTATCAQSYGTKLGATSLTTPICHFDGYTYADMGLQFTSCVTTTLLPCSDSTVAQAEKFDALDCTNSTVGDLRRGLRCWLRACFWRQSWSAHVCQRERERCLPNWGPACLPGDALLDQHKPCANWSERGL